MKTASPSGGAFFMEKKDLRQLDQAALEALVLQYEQPKFRAKQIHEWLWNKSARDIEEMSNLPKSFREALSADYSIYPLSISNQQQSADGTIKYAFKLNDGFLVEGVLIPSKDRVTACISSQVGCSLECKFCATGRLKRLRNLNHDEIYDQVVAIDKESRLYHNRPLSNIVFMGMGEPLANYDHLMKALRIVNADWGLKFGARRITVSTSGLVPQIKKLAEELVGLTILKAKALNDILKDEYGIEPAAAAVVAGPAGGDAGGAAEAKTDFDVVMTSFGGNKISVIKEVRAITGLGLKEAKDLVEAGGKAVKEGAPKAEAEEIKAKLEAAGAEVELA